VTTAWAQAGMTRTSAKVLTLITCLSALLLMVSVTGCAGDRSNQTTDPRIEERRTAERVREALAASPGYKFDGIRVAAGHGGVQLSGFVNTSAQRTRAGEIASKVLGVKSVENNVTVRD
jgi:hyperosmotically inducible periplasmic protein